MVALVAHQAATLGAGMAFDDLGVHLLDFLCRSSEAVVLGYQLGDGVPSASPFSLQCGRLLISEAGRRQIVHGLGGCLCDRDAMMAEQG